MVQLRILSGKQAGSGREIQRFPCTIGRSVLADVCLEESGVWEQHVEISLSLPEGFILKTFPNSLASVDGQRVERAVLRNGDMIELGLLKMRFWLTETQQQSLRAREVLTWLALGMLSLCQIGLIYWLSLS